MKVTRKNVWMLDLEQNSDTSKLQNIDYNLVPKLYVLMDMHMPLYFEKYFLIWVRYSLYCIKKDLHAIVGLVNGRR